MRSRFANFCALSSTLVLAGSVSCVVPSRRQPAQPTPETLPAPPAWAHPPALPPAASEDPEPPRSFTPLPPTDTCQTAYLAPLPPPLVWRVAYQGVGAKFHHCPAWSRFGPVRPNGKWHKGLDISAPTGTPLMAIVPGTLSYRRDPKGWGLYASIEFQPKQRRRDGTCETLEPMLFIYAHLIDDDPGLVIAQERPVQAGQIVGRVGCSGNATGMCSPSPESHLHLTLRHAKGQRTKVDPLPVVQWPMVTPEPNRFQLALESCPWP